MRAQYLLLSCHPPLRIIIIIIIIKYLLLLVLLLSSHLTGFSGVMNQ